jgi:predicted DNA-binding transcriptional regulator AlpA
MQTITIATVPNDSILSPKMVAALTSLSTTTIWRLRRRREFPEPARLSPGRVGWRRADVIAWLDARRVAARYGGYAAPIAGSAAGPIVTARVVREPSRSGATLGAWYVDGVWVCWNLEDEIREVLGAPVSAWKVPGRTAIPAGAYVLAYTRSERFSAAAPAKAGHAVDVYTLEVLAVPGFAGIRVHAGNWATNTEGCLLPGLGRSEASSLPPAVLDSRSAVARLEGLLVPQIQAHPGAVRLVVEAPRL